MLSKFLKYTLVLIPTCADGSFEIFPKKEKTFELISSLLFPK